MMSRQRSKVWVGVSAVSLATMLACSAGGPGSLDGDGGLGDGGAKRDGSGGGCPAAAPTAGSACALPNGTSCNYPGPPNAGPACECCSGGTPTYVCQNGAWTVVSAPTGITPTNVCPSTMPTDGSSCNPCQNHTCTYGCETSNNDPGQASCQGGRWVITRTNIACFFDAGVDAAIVDGGPG